MSENVDQNKSEYGHVSRSNIQMNASLRLLLTCNYIQMIIGLVLKTITLRLYSRIDG